MNYHPWVHYFLVYHILPLYGIVCTAGMATTQHASPYCGGYLGQSQASVLRTHPRAGILIRPVLRGGRPKWKASSFIRTTLLSSEVSSPARFSQGRRAGFKVRFDRGINRPLKRGYACAGPKSYIAAGCKACARRAPNLPRAKLPRKSTSLFSCGHALNYMYR